MRLTTPSKFVTSTQAPNPVSGYSRMFGHKESERILGDSAAELALSFAFGAGRGEADQRASQRDNKFGYVYPDRFLPLLPILPILADVHAPETPPFVVSPSASDIEKIVLRPSMASDRVGHAYAPTQSSPSLVREWIREANQDVDMEGSPAPGPLEWLGRSDNAKPSSTDNIFAFNVTPGHIDSPVFNPLEQPGRSPILPYNSDFRPFTSCPPVYEKHLPDLPVIKDHSTSSITSALSRWFVDQVVTLLVKPGQFRSGVGGASDLLWDSSITEQGSWLRVGYIGSDADPWRRVAEQERPSSSDQCSRPRSAASEPVDPWHVLSSNRPDRSFILVEFVQDIIHRMHFTPTAVVAAVWFLMGLGFHDGDGQKGIELREYLRDQQWFDTDAVEKRVAALGLLLAGKWLDDNSYNIKAWNELTLIPVKELQRMERCALADLHYSLYLPVSIWVGHVNSLYNVIVGGERDGYYRIVCDVLESMFNMARASESSDPKMSIIDLCRGLAKQDLPAAGDQAITRDWAAMANAYSIDSSHSTSQMRFTDSQIFGFEPGAGDEIEEAFILAERNVGRLVDEDNEDNKDEEDEDEEFLEYDGAKRFFPLLSHTPRAPLAASASVRPIQEIHQHRQIPPPIRLGSAIVLNEPSRSTSVGIQPQQFPDHARSVQPVPSRCDACGFDRSDWRMKEVPNEAVHPRLPPAWYEKVFQTRIPETRRPFNMEAYQAWVLK